MECLLEAEIRPTIESLERASQVTEEDLRREFRPGGADEEKQTHASPRRDHTADRMD